MMFQYKFNTSTCNSTNTQKVKLKLLNILRPNLFKLILYSLIKFEISTVLN